MTDYFENHSGHWRTVWIVAVPVKQEEGKK
jgi:hypothetical protein